MENAIEGALFLEGKTRPPYEPLNNARLNFSLLLSLILKRTALTDYTLTERFCFLKNYFGANQKRFFLSSITIFLSLYIYV